MIAEVEKIEEILAAMVVAKQPDALRHLGIDAGYITSILRPVVDMLRADALAVVEEKLRLQRMVEEKEALISSQKDEIFRLTVERRKLAAQVEALKSGGIDEAKPVPVVKTSENSSLPPSRDAIGFKRTQSLRPKSQRPTGGQPGHKGYTKEQTSTPNMVELCVPAVCPKCGRPINKGGLHIGERRQIWDIPLPIAPIVKEYQIMEGECECGCRCRGEFPAEAVAPVSYGPNVSALIGYMSTLQAIPFKRMVDILNNIFALNMSQGTVSNILRRMQKKASVETGKIKAAIETAPVVGADETGIKINGRQHWVWVFQTDMLSYLFVDKGRGKAVIDKHFPDGLPKSTVVSDRLPAYFNIATKDNQVCLAHLLRNLLYLSQTTPQSDWAATMMDLLRRAIHLKHEHPDLPEDSPEVTAIKDELDTLLNEKEIPKTDDPEQQKLLTNFILNLLPKKQYILTFLRQKDVPSDNNASERAVRPVKTKMKVSGQFKNEAGAEAYTSLHSIVQTARKNGKNPYAALLELAKS